MADNLPTATGSAERPTQGAGYSGFGPPPYAETDQGVNWNRYLAALYRYKWVMLLVIVVGSSAGAAATRLLKSEYLAQATLWVENEKGDAGPIRSPQLLDSYAWLELLKSYIVLDEVVRQLRLYAHFPAGAAPALTDSFDLGPRFVPDEYVLAVSGREYVLRTSAGMVVDRGAVGDSIGTELGFIWQPPASALPAGTEVKFSVTTPRDAALRMAANLSGRIDRNGNLLRVELIGAPPPLVARAVNATIERFVEVAADLKREKLTERRKILREQLDYAAVNLREAEMALEDFRVRTITLPTDRTTPLAPGLELTRDPVFGNYFKMQVDRDQVRRDQEAIARALAASSDSGLSVDALMVIGAVQESSNLQAALRELATKQVELRTLRYRYTDENPEVARLLAELRELEVVTIPRMARALIRELEARVTEFDRRIAAASQDLAEIPTRAIEEARLRRQVDIAEDLYTNLQNRFEETRLAEASSIPDVRVLDRAIVPRTPIRQQGMRLILAAVVGSIGLAVAGAIFADRVDRRLRYPEQVSHELGLPILGAVPHVKLEGNGRQSGGPGAVGVIEALRGVRLGIKHAYGTAGPMLLTVTSPGSGDGKSFLASNLALAMADGGQRTLLIDGDLRQGELHRVIGGSRKPGLTDYLAGRVRERDIIQSTAYPSLDFVGGGTRMRQAPELLATEAMSALLLSARQRYDVVLIDSPPLSAGVDPLLLGTVSGHLMLVLRTGVTDRELTEAKLDVIDRMPIRVLGAVLNDIRFERQYRYYAYQYYLDAYEAREEQPVTPLASGDGHHDATLPEGGEG